VMASLPGGRDPIGVREEPALGAVRSDGSEDPS
jgi:hypothetical protein